MSATPGANSERGFAAHLLGPLVRRFAPPRASVSDVIERAGAILVQLPWARRIRGSAMGWLVAPLYWLYTWWLWRKIRAGSIPRHLALVIDGNRRFAERSGLASVREGYAAGAKRVDDVLEWSARAGIHAVTLWAMSVDNLKRPGDQLEALSSVIESKLSDLLPIATARGWRLRGIGRQELLPESLQAALERVERETQGGRAMTVQFAVGYGGREEIVDALKRWASQAGVSGLSVEEALARLTPEDLKSYLYAGDVPDPDLILRTSGEVRLSGFLLWQSVYSEFYFTDVLWPEFREVDFLRAIRDFQGRQRRFGL